MFVCPVDFGTYILIQIVGGIAAAIILGLIWWAEREKRKYRRW